MHFINWRVNLYSFDASALIDLWDNYPIQNIVFEDLWDKFAENVENKIFVISDVAIEEVRNKILYDKITQDIPKSANFKDILNEIKVIKKENVDLVTVQKIHDLLEIVEDNYGEGVGENDIFIIAIAKRTQTILVNNEATQPNLPQNKSKYKIPAVCSLSGVNVESINLTELLHEPNLW